MRVFATLLVALVSSVGFSQSAGGGGVSGPPPVWQYSRVLSDVQEQAILAHLSAAQRFTIELEGSFIYTNRVYGSLSDAPPWTSPWSAGLYNTVHEFAWDFDVECEAGFTYRIERQNRFESGWEHWWWSGAFERSQLPSGSDPNPPLGEHNFRRHHEVRSDVRVVVYVS